MHDIMLCTFCVFFFQAEDGIRDLTVTGVQTCALPISDTSQHVASLKFSGEPSGGTGANALKTGRQFYDSIGCRKCHGDQGRGGGPAPPPPQDDARLPPFSAGPPPSRRGFRRGGRAGAP